MCQFKIGDKVKCVTDKYANGQKHSDGRVGEIYTFIGMYDGEIHTEECDYIFEGHMLVNLEDVVTTPKSMLKDFMRVINTKGEISIVAKGNIYKEDGWDPLSMYDADLFNSICPEFSIEAIYMHPSCEWGLLNFEKVGTIIWQRESPEDIAKKNKRFDLMASMKTLQTELDVMKKQLEDLK